MLVKKYFTRQDIYMESLKPKKIEIIYSLFPSVGDKLPVDDVLSQSGCTSLQALRMNLSHIRNLPPHVVRDLRIKQGLVYRISQQREAWCQIRRVFEVQTLAAASCVARNNKLTQHIKQSFCLSSSNGSSVVRFHRLEQPFEAVPCLLFSQVNLL